MDKFNMRDLHGAMAGLPCWRGALSICGYNQHSAQCTKRTQDPPCACVTPDIRSEVSQQVYASTDKRWTKALVRGASLEAQQTRRTAAGATLWLRARAWRGGAGA